MRKLTKLFRYLTTNYEHHKFSVSQARFEDSLSENIVAITSAHPLPTKSHNRISRNSIIGLSFGVTACLILIVFVVYLTRKWLRKHSLNNDMSRNAEPPKFSQDIKPENPSTPHEIDNNSMYQQVELPDTGRVELLVGKSPSGSDKEMAEMPQSPTPVPTYELGTRHTSIATSTLHRQSDRIRNAIYVRNGFSRQSGDSFSALKESPCVETVISSSPRHESLDLERPLPTPPERTAEYLNRALPSIPNSESTQISPTKTSSSGRFSVTNCLHSLSSRTSTTFSDSGTDPLDNSLDMVWNDYDMSWESHHRQEPSLSSLSRSSTNIEIMILPEVAGRQIRRHPSLSSLPTEIEIVVPPGTPKSQIPNSPRSRTEERRTQGNFF